jgi:hypothetical protein
MRTSGLGELGHFVASFQLATGEVTSGVDDAVLGLQDRVQDVADLREVHGQGEIISACPIVGSDLISSRGRPYDSPR